MVDPTVLGAIIGAAPATLIGAAAWVISRRQLHTAQRVDAMTNFRWGVDKVTSTDAAERVAGWVILQSVVVDPSLTDADRRMMEATTIKLRALGGGGT